MAKASGTLLMDRLLKLAEEKNSELERLRIF